MTQPIMDRADRELYARIVAGIENGGRLSKEVLGYIETSLFSPDPESLAVFLVDDDNCERDSLLDLIFFPDHDLQIEIEPLLESRIFSHEDEEDLDHLLAGQTISAPIHMPDGRPCDPHHGSRFYQVSIFTATEHILAIGYLHERVDPKESADGGCNP